MGPEGLPLTLKMLPSPGTQRWVARRKAEIVTAVRGGLLTEDEVCARYRLSVDEYRAWERAFTTHGLRGLFVSRRTRVNGATVGKMSVWP